MNGARCIHADIGERFSIIRVSRYYRTNAQHSAVNFPSDLVMLKILATEATNVLFKFVLEVFGGESSSFIEEEFCCLMRKHGERLKLYYVALC